MDSSKEAESLLVDEPVDYDTDHLEAPIVGNVKVISWHALRSLVDNRSKSSSSQVTRPDPASRPRVEIYRPVMAGWRLVVIFSCLAIGLFLSLMDTVCLSTALVTISEEFDDFKYSYWAILSYMLAYVGAGVLFARLGDVYGRKPPVIACFVIFGVFSIGCALSQTLDQLIFFRALQGIGGTGLYAMTMIVLPELSPAKWLPYMAGYVGVILAVAGTGGPILGGVLALKASWRWIFWLNVPCTFIPVTILYIVWERDDNWKKIIHVELHQVDFVGLTLLITGSVLLAFNLEEAGTNTFAWNSALVVTLFIISGSSFVGLVFWQWYISRPRGTTYIAAQFPWRIMTDRVMMSGILSTMLTGFVWVGTHVNLPQRAQIVGGVGPIEAGTRLLVMMAVSSSGSAIAGILSAGRNNTFYTLVAGCAFMAAGTGVLSTLTYQAFVVETNEYVGMALLGFGVGLTLATMTMMMSIQTQFRDHAVGQALIAQSRVLGGVVGVAVSTVLFNKQIQKNYEPTLSSDALDTLYKSPAILANLDLGDKLWVLRTYSEAFGNIMRLYSGLSFVALILALFTYQRAPVTMLEKKAQLEQAYNAIPQESEYDIYDSKA